LITLRDDTELTGFIVTRAPDEWVLRGEDLTERRLKTIAAMHKGLLPGPSIFSGQGLLWRHTMRTFTRVRYPDI
jgi:hypothetical protein